MTILYPASATCAVCGTVSEHLSVGSTSQFGAPDLDMRPPELARSTLAYEVQQCPSCGYSAVDLERATKAAAGIVRSAGYRAIWQDSTYPDVARAFLCAAMIAERSRRLDGAGWMALQAAWVCDDAKAAALSAACRTRAVELFDRVLARGRRVTEDLATDHALAADLCRRAGQFAEAAARVARGLESDPSDTVRTVLQFEQFLAQKGDIDAHTVAEALEWDPGPNDRSA